MDSKQETKMVKAALKALGIKARVGHGTGTAANWLHVTFDVGSLIGDEHDGDRRATCSGLCPSCVRYRAIQSWAMPFLMDLTDRSGDYHGEISLQLDGYHEPAEKPVTQAPTSRLVAMLCDHGFSPECNPVPQDAHMVFIEALGL